jgi:hypothetical protein
MMSSRFVHVLVLLAVWLLAAVPGRAQTTEARTPLALPPDAIALEGLPNLRIDTDKDRVRRQVLDAQEAAQSRLTIKVADGKLYWAGEPVKAWEAGGFTYLSSAEPGRYIRLQYMKDKLSYVEHVDMSHVCVTYWGELRIVLAR